MRILTNPVADRSAHKFPQICPLLGIDIVILALQSDPYPNRWFVCRVEAHLDDPRPHGRREAGKLFEFGLDF